jgi:hypothetical protein
MIAMEINLPLLLATGAYAAWQYATDAVAKAHGRQAAEEAA